VKLRAQVLLVGLVTLAVPVLGWQSVRQLHASLQETRADAQTLAVANLRVALAAAPSLVAALAIGRVAEGQADWYAETARWPLFVDGYADDWQELAGETYRYGTDTTLALRTARRPGRLFLFLRVRDDTRVRHVPPRLPVDAGENERPDPETLRANGDSLEVYVRTPDGETTHALLSVIAPGPVAVLEARRRTSPAAPVPGWRAEWVDVAGGYQVEIALPLPPGGSRVGIAVTDVQREGGPRDAWVGTMSPVAMNGSPRQALMAQSRSSDARDGGHLFHESPDARAVLFPWVPPGVRARLFDRAGRLVADVDALYAPLPERDEPPPSLAVGVLDAILFRLFAWFAAGDLPLFAETEKTRQALDLDAGRRAIAMTDAPPTTRYVTVDNDRVLGTLVALGASAAETTADDVTGYLLFESNEEHVSIATGSRLARLFAVLLLTSLVVVTLLFAWATRLSLRIRRLSRAASRAVDTDGRVGVLAGSGARDEIGELSRDLSALLARSAAYTRYLETLSRRLSHELGTPLSVVRTSLENVDRERLDDASATLIERAGRGAERLGSIVRALIDSTRLEQSVQQAAIVPVELRAWLDEAVADYAQIHPDRSFVVSGTGVLSPSVGDRTGTAIITGAGDRSGDRAVDDGGGVVIAKGRDAPPRRLRAQGSPTLLRQALDKLVANAVDFATTPTIAVVLARRDDDERTHVTIAIGNRGPGIGPEDRSRLFEPAFSTRAGPSGRADGASHSGLGLHLVRLIAEAHGGEAFAMNRRGGVVVGLRIPLESTGRPVARFAWENEQ